MGKRVQLHQIRSNCKKKPHHHSEKPTGPERKRKKVFLIMQKDTLKEFS